MNKREMKKRIYSQLLHVLFDDESEAMIEARLLS